MTSRLLKLLVASLLVAPLLAVAAVPATVNFSARIADAGRPVAGLRSFTFTLWTVETGGTAGVDDVWLEGPRDITVTDGVVSTALGDPANGAPALAPLFTGTDLFLEVTMGTTTFPRIKLQSVPYAMRAALADSVPWAGVTGAPARPAAKSAFGGFRSITANTWTTVATNSVTFPSAGYAFVIFETEPYQCGMTNGMHAVDYDGAEVRSGYYESATTGYPHPITRSFVIAVSAGGHTLSGRVWASVGCGTYNSELSVIFVPNTL